MAAGQGRPDRGARLRELARLFLRLGTTAFGGPAAHVALMEEEVVGRRGWLSLRSWIERAEGRPHPYDVKIHPGD